MKRPKTIKIEAIELREAKKPLVVENRPISANAKVGKLISGDKNTLSTLECHDKSGAKPVKILLKKLVTLLVTMMRKKLEALRRIWVET